MNETQTKEVRKQNKMGYMPINKLLLTMSLPIIISMLIQALYNIVDSMFVSQISENALTAVSLAFPIQNLIIGINTGTGVGINAVLSKSLGAKDYERANHVAGNGLFLALVGYLVILVVGLTCTRAYFEIQTDVQEIIEMGYQYTSIVCIMSFGVFALITFERLLQSTGRTMYSMVCQMTGAILNIVLDPILIFGYFGLPAMGVSGAAWATVIGQIIAAILGAIINHKLNHDITISPKYMKPKAEIIKKIYVVGLPSIIMNCIGSVMTYALNKIIIVFSTTASAVLGSYFKLQSFVFMPVFGLNNGMVPIIAFNYGARQKDRIKKTIKLSMVYASILMLAGMIVMMVLPDKLLGIFNASENMLEIGVPALRTIASCFIFAGFNIVTLSVCQSLGHGTLGMIVSIVRQLVVLIPAAWTFSKLSGLDAVWFAFPFAEIFSFVLCIIFLRRMYANIINKIEPTNIGN